MNINNLFSDSEVGSIEHVYDPDWSNYPNLQRVSPPSNVQEESALVLGPRSPKPKVGQAGSPGDPGDPGHTPMAAPETGTPVSSRDTAQSTPCTHDTVPTRGLPCRTPPGEHTAHPQSWNLHGCLPLCPGPTAGHPGQDGGPTAGTTQTGASWAVSDRAELNSLQPVQPNRARPTESSGVS